MKSKPGLFLVGAPKCGTTVLDYYLGRHPSVFMARKEMHFFGADLEFSPHFYRRAQAEYLDEFTGAGSRTVLGESSVWYLRSTTAAKEIAAFNSEARILIMLREPVEMLHSLYHQFLFDGNEHLPTFDAALAAEPGRRVRERIPRQNYFAGGLLYRENIRYAGQVQRYFAAFGRERVRVVIYDDLVADAESVYAGVIEFLELPRVRLENGGMKAINGNKFVKNQAARAFLNDPLVRSAALAVRPWLPRMLFSGLQKVEAGLRKLNTRPAQRKPVAPELREQLTREFAPEVARLSDLLGRDLSAWSADRHWQHDLDTVQTGAETPASVGAAEQQNAEAPLHA